MYVFMLSSAYLQLVLNSFKQLKYTITDVIVDSKKDFD